MNIDKANSKGFTDINVSPPAAKRTEKKADVEKQETPKDKIDIQGKEEWGVGSGIKRAWGGVKDWVHDNVTGHSVGPDGEKSVSRICSDYRSTHKDFAKAGAAVGGAVGTAVGLLEGYSEVKSDQVELAYESKDIGDPKLTGYSHYAQEDGHYERYYTGTDSEGNSQYSERYVVDGYWHRFSPNIRYDKVGSYKVPGYNHSNKWTPISAGFAGLVGGTILGGVLGFSVSMINKLVRNRVSAGQKK
ncbi:MAG: hypothetical protein K8T10_06220 [Candidatus Eremiobacteraeota bacterium]|nr:hypothetical protein [Candidatus Eremiobacteraeota bacterium]